MRVELQQLAVIALDQLTMDLGQTPPAGISVAPPSVASTAIALQPLTGVMASGDQSYAGSIVVYSWSTTGGSLIGKTWPPASQPLSVSVPTLLSPAQVLSIGQTTNGTERTPANGVTSFRVGTGPGPGVSQPLTIQLALQRTSTAPPQSYQIVRQILVRNS